MIKCFNVRIKGNRVVDSTLSKLCLFRIFKHSRPLQNTIFCPPERSEGSLHSWNPERKDSSLRSERQFKEVLQRSPFLHLIIEVLYILPLHIKLTVERKKLVQCSLLPGQDILNLRNTSRLNRFTVTIATTMFTGYWKKQNTTSPYFSCPLSPIKPNTCIPVRFVVHPRN